MKPAVAAGIDDDALAADLDGAGDDHVEVALVPTLVREGRAGGDLLHLGEFRDPLQVTSSAPANSGIRSSMAILSLMAGPFHELAVTGPPRPHDLAKGRELADVIRVVVADDAHLAQERVARRVGQDRD